MPPVRNVSADAGESQPVGVTMHSGAPPLEEMSACFVERFPVVAGGSTAWGFLNRRGGTQADRDVSQRSTPKVPGVDDVEGAAGRLPWLCPVMSGVASRPSGFAGLFTISTPFSHLAPT